MADVVNINGGDRHTSSRDVDAHGQAALMLAESMLHALVERRAITTEDALSIIQTAQDVKVELEKDMHDKSTTSSEALNLLGRIATSFASDLN